MIEYLPVDEEHVTYTTDAYSFSKNVIEAIGDYYWRRAGISSVALRLPAVWPSSRINSEEFRTRQAQVRSLIDEFAAQADAGRQARLAKLRQQTEQYRAQGNMEYPTARDAMRRRGDFSDDPLFPVYAFDRLNFWTYVDERDSAQSIEKGLTADYEGSHILFINDQYNWVSYNSKELARLFFPEVTQFKSPLDGFETLVSIAKARALIGFDPEYTVQL